MGIGRFQSYGFEDGMRDGQESGELEGRIFGCEKSFELGREIGYYDGCAEAWKQLAELYPNHISQRLKAVTLAFNYARN